MRSIHTPATEIGNNSRSIVIGVGRGGAVLSPWLAGLLIDPTGVSTRLPIEKLAFVATIMAMGSLLAAGVLFFLNLNVDRPAAETKTTARKVSELRSRPV